MKVKYFFRAFLCLFLVLITCSSCASFDRSSETTPSIINTLPPETSTAQTETSTTQPQTTAETTSAHITAESRADAYEVLFNYIMENGTQVISQANIRNVRSAKATRAITFSDVRKTKFSTQNFDYFMGASQTENKVTLIADNIYYYVTITIPKDSNILIEYKHITEKEGAGLRFEGSTTLEEGSRFGNSAYWKKTVYHTQDIDSEEAIYNTLINLSHIEKYFTENNVGIVFKDLGFTFPTYDAYAMQFIYPR